MSVDLFDTVVQDGYLVIEGTKVPLTLTHVMRHGRTLIETVHTWRHCGPG